MAPELCVPDLCVPELCVVDLVCRYRGLPVLGPLTGCFAPGSLTAVAGPNGAGKSTLLRALCGLHEQVEGRIERGGLAPADIALLPQAGTLDRRFPIACAEVVASGALARLGPFRRLPAGMGAKVEAALAAVGLAGCGRRLVGELSAGQFQRLLFARMILQDAPVLLLDEPFAAVDAPTTADLLALIDLWHREGRTVAVVLHDLDLARAAFPEALLLVAGRAAAWGPAARVLTAEALAQAQLSAGAWPAVRAREAA